VGRNAGILWAATSWRDAHITRVDDDDPKRES